MQVNFGHSLENRICMKLLCTNHILIFDWLVVVVLQATPRPTGRQSPLPVSSTPMFRADSIGNLNSTFNTTPMSVGSSRGPSPLTIGMSDSIPIAVAFFETVNALFKGTDENRSVLIVY